MNNKNDMFAFFCVMMPSLAERSLNLKEMRDGKVVTCWDRISSVPLISLNLGSVKQGMNSPRSRVATARAAEQQQPKKPSSNSPSSNKVVGDDEQRCGQATMRSRCGRGRQMRTRARRIEEGEVSKRPRDRRGRGREGTMRREDD